LVENITGLKVTSVKRHKMTQTRHRMRQSLSIVEESHYKMKFGFILTLVLTNSNLITQNKLESCSLRSF
jgi:hypothetical protein